MAMESPGFGNKNRRFDKTYMQMAFIWSSNSYCVRKKVGVLIVKDGMIISDGFNGTPRGRPNRCEDDTGETFWEVIHAEANALMKLARSGNSSLGATMYTTLSPCRDCSKLILQSGINRLVYERAHSDDSGLRLLEHAGVEIVHLPLSVSDMLPFEDLANRLVSEKSAR